MYVLIHYCTGEWADLWLVHDFRNLPSRTRLVKHYLITCNLIIWYNFAKKTCPVPTHLYNSKTWNLLINCYRFITFLYLKFNFAIHNKLPDIGSVIFFIITNFIPKLFILIFFILIFVLLIFLYSIFIFYTDIF